MFGLSRRPGAQSEGYSGSESYRHIDRLINGNGSVLKVITPYISADYSRMLLRAAKRKRVYVLVSGGQSKREEEAVKMLLNRGRRINIKLVLTLILIILGLAALSLYLYSTIGAVMLIIALPIYLKRKPASKLKAKIATSRFVHEKMYISDEEAIVGSANLTYSGTHRNIEHIEIIRDRRRVDELSEHFDDIWSRH